MYRGTYHTSRGFNPDVLAKFLIWTSYHHDHLTLPSIGSSLLSPVTIPLVVDVNEDVFSVNLPGKIKIKLKQNSSLGL